MSWTGSSKTPFEDFGMTEQRLGMLVELNEEGGYWGMAYRFIMRVKDLRQDVLTNRQKEWIHTIIDDLGKELKRRTIDAGPY